MKDLVLSNQAHTTFPHHFQLSGDIEKVDTFTIEKSQHMKIKFDTDEWQNVRKILIKDCRFIELLIHFTKESHLEEISIQNTDYMHIKEINGVFPRFSRIVCQNCRMLKVSGPFLGDISVRVMEFVNCPYLHLIRKDGVLPDLNTLKFENCPHLSVNFEAVQLPLLDSLVFSNSPYLQLKKSALSFSRVTKILVEQCSYTKIEDIEQFPALESFIIKKSNQILLPSALINDKILELIESKPIINTTYLEQLTALEHLTIEDKSESAQLTGKICPYCLELLKIDQKTCPVCGASFELKD